MTNLNSNTEFHGKRVIVTGASKGLGAALCEALASRGAKIAMLSRSLNKMNNLKKKLKNSSNHISIKLNLLNNKQIKSAINRARIFLKDVDIVIHVAGGGFGLKDALISHKDLNTLLQVNLIAAAEINRLIVKRKNKKHKLKLIHVGSIASNEAVGSVGYNVAKSALSTYVRSLGRELYKNNVIATGILPGGFIATDNAMARFKIKNLKCNHSKFYGLS